MQNLVNPSKLHNHETLARCRYGRMQLKASGAINGNLISKLQSSCRQYFTRCYHDNALAREIWS